MKPRLIQINDTQIYAQDLGIRDRVVTGDVRLATGEVVDSSWSGLPVGEEGFVRPLLTDDDIKAVRRLAVAKHEPARVWAIGLLRDIGVLS